MRQSRTGPRRPGYRRSPSCGAVRQRRPADRAYPHRQGPAWNRSGLSIVWPGCADFPGGSPGPGGQPGWSGHRARSSGRAWGPSDPGTRRFCRDFSARCPSKPGWGPRNPAGSGGVRRAVSAKVGCGAA